MLWKTDASHTSINFVARHMMLAKVKGEFQNFNVDFNLDTEHPENASVEARIQAASIFTKDGQRDAHLKSADFLNVETYPELVFKSTKIERTGDETARVHGDLTIRNVTKPVALDVTYLGSSKSPWGATSIGFEAKTKIMREDWDLTWNVALETGGWLVGKEITIEIEAEFVQQPQTVQEPSAAGAMRSGATAETQAEQVLAGVS